MTTTTSSKERNGETIVLEKQEWLHPKEKDGKKPRGNAKGGGLTVMVECPRFQKWQRDEGANGKKMKEDDCSVKTWRESTINGPIDPTGGAQPTQLAQKKGKSLLEKKSNPETLINSN